MAGLTELDRRIVLATQQGLPLTARPFQTLAAELGVDVDLIRERMQCMLEAGVIRRIGAVPNHYRLGFAANGMSVWDVDDDRIAALGPRVGALPFVSHAYRRPRRLPDWPYNLFAMVHGRSRQEVMQKVDQVAAVLGGALRGSDVLFSTRLLKKTGLSSTPPPGLGGRAQRRPDVLYLSVYARSGIAHAAGCAAEADGAGGDLEPHPALQPDLQTLLLHFRGHRLSGRA